LHEIKIDGYRQLAIRDTAGVRLLTRHGTDWTDRFPKVYAAVSKLRCQSCLIDGEVGAPDDRGIPCFDSLRRRQPALLYAFDLIEIDGVDLRHEPIEARKGALAKLLRGATGAGIMFCDHIEGDAREIFAQACKLGYEGIVCKRAGSRYRSGRSLDWFKIKNPESAAARRDAESFKWHQRKSR
jgi:bifunctional non-homologous end joining protein LigD